MAKINNKLIYALEDLPQLLDYLIGSKDKNGKTRNFSLQSIINLINGVNGKNVIQYQFFSELTPDVDYTSPGAMFTNNNETDVNNFSSLILNKSTLGNYDLTILFDFLSGLEDLFIGVDNPSNPNNFFTFKITSITNQDDYFIFNVEPYNDMYIGELSNESIYSIYWETKEWISELDYINTELDTKLPHGGYNGSGQVLKNEIDAINQDLDDNYYTKPEIDSKISSIYRYKGNKDTYADLPTSGQEVGDVWNMLDTDINWAWTGTVWDNIGGSVDVSGKEDKSNKQNSLAPDGTGIKYITVDATRAGLDLKLEKGPYPGNAQDLKTDIDNIYQPDVLISSVPPTRSTNTFTYPATQYTALITKTIRTNPAQFITTIAAASTTDHKRVDLIYFKSDNTLVKVVGTESLTVAPRPDIPVGIVGVPVSFINVFGNVISDPTPVTNEISIQNSLGTEIFKVPENGFMRFKGASFNANAKQIEIDPLVGGVIFVSNSGVDATAEPENRNKPYKTLNAAIAAFWNNASISYIEIIDSSTYSTNVIFNNGTTRKFDLRSNNSCIVNVTTTVAPYALDNQELNINMLNGTIVFNPSVSTSSGFRNAFVTINCKNVEFGLNYLASGGNTSAVNLISENLTIRTTTGIVVGSGGARKVSIKTNYLYFRGANALLIGNFINTTLDFNILNHDNIFKLNTGSFTSMTIDHGSIESVSPYVNTTNIKYLYGLNLIIKYKTGAVLNSNVSIDRFNCNGTCVITGVVSAVNSDALIMGANNYTGLQFIDASITAKNLIGGNNNIAYINFINSYISLTSGGYLISYKEASASITYVSPTLEFTGSNFIIGGTDGFALTSDETSWVSTNNPTIQITKGVLNTNGKFNRQTININEAPLNQYFDTVQRQLVLVDEKEEIINKVLDSTKTYIINGIIPLASGDFILEPAGGLTIAGYGYNTSGFTKNTAGQSIIKSAVGGSGDLTLKDMFFQSGAGSVFDLTDISGQHAIEMNDVNFNNCASLGTISGYRQFTGQTIGVYGCSDGLTLAGTWNGFSIAKMHVRTFGTTGTLFKKGLSATFSNRFSLGVNISSNTGYKLLDFDNTMFTKDKTLQLSDCTVEVSGVINASNTSALIPNILPNDPKSKFYNSEGITLSAVEFLEMKSPDGNIWRLSIDNAGALVITDI